MLFAKRNIKKCVTTLNINCSGENNGLYPRLSKLTIPSMVDYCSRIGASFHMINTTYFNTTKRDWWGSNVWEKFQIKNLLEKFDKVLYLDLDCYISKKCPDIFEIYAESNIACRFTSVNQQQINYCAANIEGFVPTININSGVMFVGKSVAQFLCPPNLPPKLDHGCAEEQWFASCFERSGIPITLLDYDFNSMDQVNPNYKIYHAIIPKGEAKIEAIKKMIEKDSK
jgi:hypothetical protein